MTDLIPFYRTYDTWHTHYHDLPTHDSCLMTHDTLIIITCWHESSSDDAGDQEENEAEIPVVLPIHVCHVWCVSVWCLLVFRTVCSLSSGQMSTAVLCSLLQCSLLAGQMSTAESEFCRDPLFAPRLSAVPAAPRSARCQPGPGVCLTLGLSDAQENKKHHTKRWSKTIVLNPIALCV